MTYYEKGEWILEEKYTRNGMSREHVDEEKWENRDPGRSSIRLSDNFDRNRRSIGQGVIIPTERLIDDFHRTEHRIDDGGFYTRRPPPPIGYDRDSRHSASFKEDRDRYYSVRDSGYRSSAPIYEPPPYDRPLSTALTRPGSPGPVAGSGDIINTEHGFTIQLDVKHFRPEEIKILLTDDLLSISGERLEETRDGQTLKRSFTRKYSIPPDVHLDSIRSHLSDSGFLIVNGSRRGWKETSISMHPSGDLRHPPPPSYRNGRPTVGGNVISNV